MWYAAACATTGNLITGRQRPSGAPNPDDVDWAQNVERLEAGATAFPDGMFPMWDQVASDVLAGGFVDDLRANRVAARDNVHENRVIQLLRRGAQEWYEGNDPTELLRAVAGNLGANGVDADSRAAFESFRRVTAAMPVGEPGAIRW